MPGLVQDAKRQIAGLSPAQLRSTPWWSYDYGQSWKLDATTDLLPEMVHK